MSQKGKFVMVNSQSRLLHEKLMKWRGEMIKQKGVAFYELTRAVNVRRCLFMRWRERLDWKIKQKAAIMRSAHIRNNVLKSNCLLQLRLYSRMRVRHKEKSQLARGNYVLKRTKSIFKAWAGLKHFLHQQNIAI